MTDVVCITGLFGCLFLYFLGRILYPDPPQPKIIPEPNNMLKHIEEEE